MSETVEIPKHVSVTLPTKRFKALVEMLSKLHIPYFYVYSDGEGVRFSGMDVSHACLVSVEFNTPSASFEPRGVIDVDDAFKSLKSADGVTVYDATEPEGRIYTNGVLIYKFSSEDTKVKPPKELKYGDGVTFRIGVTRFLKALEKAEQTAKALAGDAITDAVMLRGDTASVCCCVVDTKREYYAIPLEASADGSFSWFTYSSNILSGFLRGVEKLAGNTTLSVRLTNKGVAIMDARIPPIPVNINPNRVQEAPEYTLMRLYVAPRLLDAKPVIKGNVINTD